MTTTADTQYNITDLLYREPTPWYAVANPVTQQQYLKLEVYKMLCGQRGLDEYRWPDDEGVVAAARLIYDDIMATK